MKRDQREALSWIVSFAAHAALLGGMSVVAAVLPLEIRFQRGRTTIELQASIAAAPRAEPEPMKIDVEKTEKVEETKPVEVKPVEVAVDKRNAKPLDVQKPDATEPEEEEAEQIEVALVKVEPQPREKPPEIDKLRPPPRKIAEARPEVFDSPVESAPQAASQAENGDEYDEPPQSLAVNRKPPYPPDAYSRRHEGTVILHLRILVDGTVGQISIAQSSGYASLDNAAVSAARDWRFAPARRAGTSVAATFAQPVNFRL